MNGKTLISFCSLWFVLAGTLSGQPAAAIDRYLSSVFERHVMPGFSIVVVDRRGELFSAGYGVTRLGTSRSFTPETPSPIGSLTKSVTALAILQLAEAGKLDISCPVRDYLPNFTTANPDRSDRVTVAMLLSNTAGLSDGAAAATQASTLEELLEELKHSFLSSEPGTAYRYTNSGYSIAGAVIESISGMPYADYVEQHIFGPLQMADSWVGWRQATASQGHFPGLKTPIVDNSQPTRQGPFTPAGQYAHSTARDLAQYLRFYLSGGEGMMIGPEALATLWRPVIDFVGLSKKEGGDGTPFQYGLGWMISRIDGRTVVHHGGSTGTASSFTMFDPKRGLGVALLTNIDLMFTDRRRYESGLQLVNNVLHLAAGEPLSDYARPTGTDPTRNDFTLPAAARPTYTGRYRFVRGGDAFVYYDRPELIVRTIDGQLFGTLYRNGQEINAFQLDFVTPTLAVSRNIASPSYLRFSIDTDGTVGDCFAFGMQLRRKTLATTPRIDVRYADWQLSIPENWSWYRDHTDIVLLPRAPYRGRIECSYRNTTIGTTAAKPVVPLRLNGLKWEQRSYYSQGKDGQQLVTSFTTEWEGRVLTVAFRSIPQEHTFFLQGVARSLLSSFHRPIP